MVYEWILDSVLRYTRVLNILNVASSYLTYVNVERSGKTEMQLIITHSRRSMIRSYMQYWYARLPYNLFRCDL